MPISTHTNERILGYYIVRTEYRCKCGHTMSLTGGPVMVQCSRSTYKLQEVIDRYKRLAPNHDPLTMLPAHPVVIRGHTIHLEECERCIPLELGSEDGWPNMPAELPEVYAAMESPNADIQLRINELHKEQAAPASNPRKRKTKTRYANGKRYESPEDKRKRQVLKRIEDGDVSALLEY